MCTTVQSRTCPVTKCLETFAVHLGPLSHLANFPFLKPGYGTLPISRTEDFIILFSRHPRNHRRDVGEVSSGAALYKTCPMTLPLPTPLWVNKTDFEREILDRHHGTAAVAGLLLFSLCCLSDSRQAIRGSLAFRDGLLAHLNPL